MPFQQDIESARAENIGAHGIAKAAFDAALARTSPALDWLREAHANATLPLLRSLATSSARNLHQIQRDLQHRSATVRWISTAIGSTGKSKSMIACSESGSLFGGNRSTAFAFRLSFSTK